MTRPGDQLDIYFFQIEGSIYQLFLKLINGDINNFKKRENVQVSWEIKSVYREQYSLSTKTR